MADRISGRRNGDGTSAEGDVDVVRLHGACLRAAQCNHRVAQAQRRAAGKLRTCCLQNPVAS
jgi:hypothetical protein